MPAPLLRPVWHWPFVDENRRATEEMQRTFNVLFDRLGTLEIATDEQGAEQQTLTEIINGLQAAVDQAGTRIDDDQALMEAQQTLIETLQADLAALEARVTDLE